MGDLKGMCGDDDDDDGDMEREVEKDSKGDKESRTIEKGKKV